MSKRFSIECKPEHVILLHKLLSELPRESLDTALGISLQYTIQRAYERATCARRRSPPRRGDTCPNGHPYTPENTLPGRHGDHHRRCKKCARAYAFVSAKRSKERRDKAKQQRVPTELELRRQAQDESIEWMIAQKESA